MHLDYANYEDDIWDISGGPSGGRFSSLSEPVEGDME